MSTERSVVISKMKRAYKHPEQVDFGTLRLEEGDKCPHCRKRDLWSVCFEGDQAKRKVSKFDQVLEEPCGYFCGSCGWANAGSRAVADYDLPESR